MIWAYFRAGPIERGARYEWRDGYARVHADGGIWYPWLTKREAQGMASRNGARAVFFETEAEARKALAGTKAQH